MEIAQGLSKYFKAPTIKKEMERRERRAQTKYYASLRNPDADFYRSLSAKLAGKRDPSRRKYPPKDQSQRLVYVPRGPAKVAYRCGGRGLCKREVATQVWSEVDGVRKWRPVESVPRKHGGTAPDEEEKKE
jgi:hypothetical protein